MNLRILTPLIVGFLGAGFALPKEPPPQVQFGENCRTMVYGLKLRPGVALKDVTPETLSPEVVIELAPDRLCFLSKVCPVGVL